MSEPKCEFLISTPTGPKEYTNLPNKNCDITISCVNSSDLTDVITISCAGFQRCRSWVEPWEDVYRCTTYDRRGCASVKIDKRPFTKTGTECDPCIPFGNGGCNCPQGYNKA